MKKIKVSIIVTICYLLYPFNERVVAAQGIQTLGCLGINITNTEKIKYEIA